MSGTARALVVAAFVVVAILIAVTLWVVASHPGGL